MTSTYHTHEELLAQEGAGLGEGHCPTLTHTGLVGEASDSTFAGVSTFCNKDKNFTSSSQNHTPVVHLLKTFFMLKRSTAEKVNEGLVHLIGLRSLFPAALGVAPGFASAF